MEYSDLKYLSVPLPENIEKEKWSGHFENARRLIHNTLASEGTSYPLRCRLELELNNIENIERRYVISESDALAIMRKNIPDMTLEELRRLREEDKADWMYIEGEVKYIDCFDATLYKVYPQLWNRTTEGDRSNYEVIQKVVDEVSAATKDEPVQMKAHIHIRHEMDVKKEKMESDRIVRVHMPIPVERNNIKNLKIHQVFPDPVKMPANDELQPTVYFEEEGNGEFHFAVEYEFDNTIRYNDMSKVDIEKVALAGIPSREKEFLKEEAPHICFTPFLKMTAERLADGEKNPLLIARKFYDFITTQVDYRFVRDYCSIDNLSEYCAVNRRGDCGVQALLFITLCRIAGIPAKWQSGLDAKPKDVGEHDWAMFYIPSVGWVYADLSYGGSSYIRGAYDRWNFFFGNVDPYRIPINEAFQQQFMPPKKYWRADPYDNQCGEAEYNDRALAPEEIEYRYIEIDIH